jgi:hypothetical protein
MTTVLNLNEYKFKEELMSQTRIYFNGLNGATGAPLQPPMAIDALLPLIEGSDPNLEKILEEVKEKQKAKEIGNLAPDRDIDSTDVKEAGWGIIYHPDTPAEVRNQLKKLVQHRGGKEFEYNPAKHHHGWDFQYEFKQGEGLIDPEKIPYYLLIVGAPEQIPFNFQYELDFQHAVGRLYFDNVNAYENYLNNLFDYENAGQKSPRERRVAIFSPKNPNDEATALSAAELATPLAGALGKAIKLVKPNKAMGIVYQTEHLIGQEATKPALLNLLTRKKNPPALVFAAAHGLGFPKDHPDQKKRQGALVCQEWPGPKQWKDEQPIPDSMFLAGEHLPEASYQGLVVFTFACYSAGTPRQDDFAHFQARPPQELTDHPFVAYLPQRLLAHGALAFIGHVERAWDFSFVSPAGHRDVEVFEKTLRRILSGRPIGDALEDFGQRYLSLAGKVTNLLSPTNPYEVEPDKLAQDWMAHNDARAYVLFGDPAARLNPLAMS